MNNSWIKKLFKTNLNKNNLKENKEEKNEGGIVITIGRELGSGGRKVAKEVAKKLNYDYPKIPCFCLLNTSFLSVLSYLQLVNTHLKLIHNIFGLF